MKKMRLALLMALTMAMIFGSMPATRVFAEERGREERGRYEHRGGWERHEFRGERYRYREGRFYRRGGLFGLFGRLVSPPPGIIVIYLPIGARAVDIGGVTYYDYEGVYYQPCPEGYCVARPY